MLWKVSESLIGHKLSHAISKGGETIVTQGRKITASVFKEIQKAKVEQVEANTELTPTDPALTGRGILKMANLQETAERQSFRRAAHKKV